MYDPPFSGHQMLKGLQKSRFSIFFVLKRFLGFFVIIQRVNEKGFLFKFLKRKKMLSSNISQLFFKIKLVGQMPHHVLQSVATKNKKGVFRTLQNIYDRAFMQK